MKSGLGGLFDDKEGYTSDFLPEGIGKTDKIDVGFIHASFNAYYNVAAKFRYTRSRARSGLWKGTGKITKRSSPKTSSRRSTNWPCRASTGTATTTPTRRAHLAEVRDGVIHLLVGPKGRPELSAE